MRKARGISSGVIVFGLAIAAVGVMGGYNLMTGDCLVCNTLSGKIFGGSCATSNTSTVANDSTTATERATLVGLPQDSISEDNIVISTDGAASAAAAGSDSCCAGGAPVAKAANPADCDPANCPDSASCDKDKAAACPFEAAKAKNAAACDKSSACTYSGAAKNAAEKADCDPSECDKDKAANCPHAGDCDPANCPVGTDCDPADCPHKLAEKDSDG
ncbi:MAG TPA: hypothetical protein ENJ06_05705 [Phycisphaeraceae bacterium]|nr:hypothetical protein [Phycisphaeraceae bacterium]